MLKYVFYKITMDQLDFKVYLYVDIDTMIKFKVEIASIYGNGKT